MRDAVAGRWDPATVGAALVAAERRLAAAQVPDARVDAELLLAALLGTGRGGVVARKSDTLDPRLGRTFGEWVERRARREPLQHVLGRQEFHGLEFRTDRRALVPRPETETLVDAALEAARSGGRVADLGTGSGCIVVTLAVRRPDLDLHALERSTEALELARENAAGHGVGGRIEFREGDFGAPPEDWRDRMDVVLSNPPYVAAAEWAGLQAEVREYDPYAALVAGPTGLEAYRALAAAVPTLLRPRGVVLVELAFGRAAPVVELFAAAGFSSIELRPDLRGIPRVMRGVLGAGAR